MSVRTRRRIRLAIVISLGGKAGAGECGIHRRMRRDVRDTRDASILRFADMALCGNKPYHHDKMTNAPCQDEDVPQVVGGEFSGPEVGFFGGIEDDPDGVEEASGDEPGYACRWEGGS